MRIWPFKKSQDRPSSPANDNPPNAHCSFCGRPRRHVGPMVEGPKAIYICVDCIGIAHQVAEANRLNPVAPEVNDTSVRWAGHMHILCYFRLERMVSEQWRAVADHLKDIVGIGSSPKEAVHDLQAKVLSQTAISFAESSVMDEHFTNHVDGRFRTG